MVLEKIVNTGQILHSDLWELKLSDCGPREEALMAR